MNEKVLDFLYFLKDYDNNSVIEYIICDSNVLDIIIDDTATLYEIHEELYNLLMKFQEKYNYNKSDVNFRLSYYCEKNNIN